MCLCVYVTLPLYTCRYMPVPDLYLADAASIGPVQARYWQLLACLQGITVLCDAVGNL